MVYAHLVDALEIETVFHCNVCTQHATVKWKTLLVLPMHLMMDDGGESERENVCSTFSKDSCRILYINLSIDMRIVDEG